MYAKDTKVSVPQSRAEIERLLERAKASQYGTAVDYDLGKARVQFKLRDRIVRFTISLPDRKKLPAVKFEQEERRRWRALLLVLKAKLEAVESAIETFEEAFLAHIVMPDDNTVGHHIHTQIADAYKSGKMPRLLGAGEGGAR